MAMIYIKQCTGCKDCEVGTVYTADSFEHVEYRKCTNEKWKNTKEKGRMVTDYHNWNDKEPRIPDWCPRLKKNLKKKEI